MDGDRRVETLNHLVPELLQWRGKFMGVGANGGFSGCRPISQALARIVERRGGTVWAETSSAQGARFFR